MNNYGYIYLTTNLINNKKYIGKHKSEKFEPNKYIGSGSILLKSIKKYGKENFKCELLEWCDSLDSLNKKERYWTDYYNALKDLNFYNLQDGGKSGYERSKEIKLQISRRAKEKGQWQGKNNPHYGVHKNFGTGMLGKNHTLKSKLKISESKKGQNIGHIFWGRPLNKEEKLKISYSLKNKDSNYWKNRSKNRIGLKYNHSEEFHIKQKNKQDELNNIKINKIDKRKLKSKTHIIDKNFFIYLYVEEKISYKDILKFCKFNYGVGSWTVDKFIKENNLRRKIKGERKNNI